MISKFGVSIYLSTEFQVNREIIAKAKNNGFNIVFTSFHISEEKNFNNIENIRSLINLCKEEEMFLCADVSIQTLSILNLSSLEELYSIGLSCVRFDYGIDIRTMVDLSKKHFVMINASNISEEILDEYEVAGMNFSNVIAAHNFYPKSHTGLSIEYVTEMNAICKKKGLKTLAFIPGFKLARGPIYEYLPTIESHRKEPLLVSLMEHCFAAETDYILIGDIDYEDCFNEDIKDVLNDIVLLEVEFFEDKYSEIMSYTYFNNRNDLSSETIRISQTRNNEKYKFDASPNMKNSRCEVGDIVLSNKLYLRYSNEIEIVLKSFEQNGKLNIIGRVKEPYIKCLKYISNKRAFKFIIHS